MKARFKKLFYFDEWSIGLANCKIEDFQKNKSPITWFKNNSKTSFGADPFGFQIEDKKYIIFEEYSQISKRGRIAIAEIFNNTLINKKIIFLTFSYTDMTMKSCCTIRHFVWCLVVVGSDPSALLKSFKYASILSYHIFRFTHQTDMYISFLFFPFFCFLYPFLKR